MKFENCDQFMEWMSGKIEKLEELCGNDYDDYEFTEEDEEEANAFLEIVGEVAYNYGRIEGLAASIKDFEVSRLFAQREYTEITAQIDAGVYALETYFKRIGLD